MDYIFAVLGSDHASLIDGYQKRIIAGKTTPEMLIFNHEVRYLPFTSWALTSLPYQVWLLGGLICKGNRARLTCGT